MSMECRRALLTVRTHVARQPKYESQIRIHSRLNIMDLWSGIALHHVQMVVSHNERGRDFFSSPCIVVTVWGVQFEPKHAEREKQTKLPGKFHFIFFLVRRRWPLEALIDRMFECFYFLRVRFYLLFDAMPFNIHARTSTYSLSHTHFHFVLIYFILLFCPFAHARSGSFHTFLCPLVRTPHTYERPRMSENVSVSCVFSVYTMSTVDSRHTHT